MMSTHAGIVYPILDAITSPRSDDVRAKVRKMEMSKLWVVEEMKKILLAKSMTLCDSKGFDLR